MLPEELIIVAVTRALDLDSVEIEGFSQAEFADGCRVVAEDAMLRGDDATWRDWKAAVDRQLAMPEPEPEEPAAGSGPPGPKNDA